MPKFKGEVREVKRLYKCPVCGAKSVLKKDSTKRFQVACSECECKTGWKPKTEAIIDWYNLVLAYQVQMPGFDRKEREG